MILIAGLLALVILAIMRGSPSSPLGRTLNIYLAEKPVRAASKFKRHHVIWIGVLLLLALVAGEVATVFGLDFFLVSSLDLSLYLDTVLVGAAIAARSRFRTAALLVRSMIQRWIGRVGAARKWLPRPRARGRLRGPRRHDNDEDGPLPAALAA